MEFEFNESRTCHKYVGFITRDYLPVVWGYPSSYRDQCYFNHDCANFRDEYGPPPSAELRSLIQAGAPWYAVMDKLSEEYPQWQHHFDEAIRRHQAEQPTSELRTNG